jgi:hypothetical protein
MHSCESSYFRNFPTAQSSSSRIPRSRMVLIHVITLLLRLHHRRHLSPVEVRHPANDWSYALGSKRPYYPVSQYRCLHTLGYIVRWERLAASCDKHFSCPR